LPTEVSIHIGLVESITALQDPRDATAQQASVGSTCSRPG
jgi:hypothetical protein